MLPLLMVPTTKSQLKHLCLRMTSQDRALKASWVPWIRPEMKSSTGPQPVWRKLVMTLLWWVPVRIMDHAHFSSMVWNETLFLLKLTSFPIFLIFKVCILVVKLPCKGFYDFVACEYPNKNSCLFKDMFFPVCPVSYVSWLFSGLFLTEKAVAFWRWLVL